MRRCGIQQKKERPEFPSCNAAARVYFIYKRHHRGNRGIELHLLIIFRDLFYGAVYRSLEFFRQFFLFRQNVLQLPDSVQKAVAASCALRGPRDRLIEGSHEHLIYTEGVRSDLLDNVVWVDDVAPGFRHFFTVFT